MSWTGRLGIALAAGAMAVLGAALPAGEREPPDGGPNTLTEKERAEGWKLLFDGHTTQGWRKYQGDKVPAKWSARDGALVFDPAAPGDGGDIVTVAMYDSFDLLADWKISPGGNSGIMYHVTETEEKPWQTGPEYQILDNAAHRDGLNPLTSAAACYALYAPSRDVTRPVGQWNRARLVVDGYKVQHWLNGEKVVEYVLGSDDWARRVKASKFRDLPRFGKEMRGHLCLQDHQDRVEYRNLKLRALTTMHDGR